MNVAPITTKQARAELLKINRGTLRAVHNMTGIDWNKPHQILKLYPPFTRHTIRKAAAEAGYAAALALVLLYDKNPRFYCDKNRLTVFYIDAGESLENPNTMHHCGNPGNALDDAYSKGQFDEIRKRPSSAAFVILQNDEDHAEKKPADRTPDPWTRYTARRRSCGYANHILFDLYPVKSNAPAAVADYGFYKDWKNPESPLDAGGYYKADKIRNRKRRAAALKAEREKAAYMEQDTAADVETVTAAADALRSHVARLLTSDDMSHAAEAASAVNIYGFYFWEALADSARFAAWSADHKYKSASAAAADREKILEEIRTAREKIDNRIAEEEAKTA